MDFTLDDDQQALVGLAKQILDNEVTQERLDGLTAAGVWFDEPLWAQLAEAGLVGATLAEDVGGGGLGFGAVALLLEQVGSAVAQVPLLEAVVCGALPIDRFGTSEQRRRDLPDVAAGRALVVAALVETGREDALHPTAVATPAGPSYTVSGLKSSVPFADRARRVVVPAVTAGRTVLLLVDPAAAGVTLRPGTTTNGQPVFEMELSDVPAEVLVGPDGGAEALGWLLDRALTGLAATALGVSAKALALSASYATSREQFGRPIATFQAVGHRLADAYIDVEAIRLTTLQAIWRLDAGLPGHDEARIAKWWASEGGHRVAHAAQHVHGGVGIDLDYVLHRYFTWSKHVEFALGSAQAQLLSLGATLASQPV
jgi:alkylation response protein AidB-like acyl-CoA dehydrogenase